MSFSAYLEENQSQNAKNFKSYALRQKFNQLFSHGWDFIVKETPESNWKTVKKFNLTEQKCWYKYIDPQQVIGLRFGTETTYGLYDIDWGSIHDPREQEKSLKALEGELEQYGIVSLIFVQSSESKGLHIYFFLERPVNTFRLACVMNKAAVEAGLKIERGQLETFPNTKRYNSKFNGHRLPLQQGSYLLDKDYEPYSNAIENLISAATWSAERNDTDLLESKLESAYKWFKVEKNKERVYNPTTEDKEFIEQVDYAQREIKEGFLNQIRIAVEQGFTGTHETNELLLTIAKLGRIYHGLSGQKYIDYIKETIMSCPGYLKYCRHKHEIDRRCREVGRYGEKHWYPYRTKMGQNRSTYKQIKESLTNQTNLNNERQHNASSRIKLAVDKIKQEPSGLPKKVGECKLAIRNITKELFGISVSDATLNKRENLALWHPKHRIENSEPTSREAREKSYCSQTQLPSSENSTLESNNPLETLLKSDVLLARESSSIIQKTLHSKPLHSSQDKKRATPLHVIRKKASKPKGLKCKSCKDFRVSCQTLSLMKGMITFFLIRFLYQTLLQVYSQAVIKKRDLVFIFHGYQGKASSGRLKRKRQKELKLESIQDKTEVIIKRNQFHSSYLRDHPDQILVYIKPRINADDWLGGIAVPLELLEPFLIEPKKKTG